MPVPQSDEEKAKSSPFFTNIHIFGLEYASGTISNSSQPGVFAKPFLSVLPVQSILLSLSLNSTSQSITGLPVFKYDTYIKLLSGENFPVMPSPVTCRRACRQSSIAPFA